MYYIVENMEEDSLSIEKEWDTNIAQNEYIVIGQCGKFSVAKKIAIAFARQKRKVWLKVINQIEQTRKNDL